MAPLSTRLPMIALPVALGLAMALAGCGDGDDQQKRAATAGERAEPLPAPERTGGSVTGMPDEPGPGQQALVGAHPDTPVSSDGELPGDGMRRLPDGTLVVALPSLPGDTAAPLQPPVPPQPPAPPAPPAPGGAADAGAAVGVVQAYYRSINAGNYGGAHGLWAGGGSASGQSQQQFASGFSDTRGVSVEIMQPGRIEGAAGSRYIRVPVAVSSTHDDGSVHKYAGTYTLRQSVVEGGEPEWRIDSADIREVQP